MTGTEDSVPLFTGICSSTAPSLKICQLIWSLRWFDEITQGFGPTSQESGGSCHSPCSRAEKQGQHGAGGLVKGPWGPDTWCSLSRSSLLVGGWKGGSGRWKWRGASWQKKRDVPCITYRLADAMRLKMLWTVGMEFVNRITSPRE